MKKILIRCTLIVAVSTGLVSCNHFTPKDQPEALLAFYRMPDDFGELVQRAKRKGLLPGVLSCRAEAPQLGGLWTLELETPEADNTIRYVNESGDLSLRIK